MLRWSLWTWSLGSLAGGRAHLGKGRNASAAIIKMAEKELVDEKYNGQNLDCLFVIEKAMRHFYIRAETGRLSAVAQNR